MFDLDPKGLNLDTKCNLELDSRSDLGLNPCSVNTIRGQNSNRVNLVADLPPGM